MKKEILFVIVLFFISSCFAQEITFQRQEYSPSETIIGKIDNIVSEIISSDLKIYEGRREVFFEKGILNANGSYYFYIIPTKQGEFSIKIVNVLYNNSGQVSSINLEKYFNISQTNNSLGFGVRPGVYEGAKPEIVITNLKLESINISLNGNVLEIPAEESKRIELNTPEGFYIYLVGNYSLPIINTKAIVNLTNESVENTNSSETPSCLLINSAPVFSLQINTLENYTIELKNNCSENIEGLFAKTTYEGIKIYFDNLNLGVGESKNVILGLVEKVPGEYRKNISFYVNKTILAEKSINIYFFENKTNLEIFNQAFVNNTPVSCSALGGKFCESNEKCSTENVVYDSEKSNFCCLSECMNPSSMPLSWVNILFSLLGIVVISYIIYILLKRSGKLKAPKAEDKFKEAEKKYEQKFSDEKKAKD
jgi:hypothetical protein